MSKINVALLGATGEAGKSVLNGLVDDGSFVGGLYELYDTES